MTVIVFRPGGIVHTHENVHYIETETAFTSPPTLELYGYHRTEHIATLENYLKIEVLP